MRWREIGPYLRELWQRPAGPMNWKNPIRVFAVLGWLVVQGFVLLGWAGFRVFRFPFAGQFVAGLPPLLLFFFAAVGWAGWSFVHRPFPPLDEHPILVLVEYHTPKFLRCSGRLVLRYALRCRHADRLYFRHHLEGLAGRAAERFRILLQAPAVAA